MAIKKYLANKDTTITNAFKPGLQYRTTGSNMGESDTGEIFRIYAQESTSSSELSRILIGFPVSRMSEDRTNGDIPASGNVNFYLRMFNAKHSFTLPKKYTLSILPVSRSWQEGFGKDLDSGGDEGYANWEYAQSASSGLVAWTSEGGDFHSGPEVTAYFEDGDEDLEVDVSDVVEQWIGGTKDNDGLVVKLTDAIEGAVSSSYTKRFFMRGSEFFHYRPCVEARWDDSKKDNRGNFMGSSSLASAEDNLNTIYIYNRVRGRLANIPDVGTGAIYVQIWSEGGAGTQLTSTPITGGYVDTGIYSASFALDTSLTKVYDRWFNSGLTICYHTGGIDVDSLAGNNYNPNPRYLISMPHLKSEYYQGESARMRVSSRERDWSPNIYTVAQSDVQQQIIDDLYYKVDRATDGLTIIDYGTGSVEYSKCSYDVSGSYFDLDMSLFESGYAYRVSFLMKVGTNLFREQKEKFRFKIV